jgi:hypothetical protein
MKICKTCRYWSMEKKGFCHYENRGVGQFWGCEHWLAAAPGQGIDETKKENSCQACAVGGPK